MQWLCQGGNVQFHGLCSPFVGLAKPCHSESSEESQCVAMPNPVIPSAVRNLNVLRCTSFEMSRFARHDNGGTVSLLLYNTFLSLALNVSF